MTDWPELTQLFRVIAVPCHREHFLAGGHPDDDTRGVEKRGRSREKRLKIAFRLQTTDRGAQRRCLPEIDRGWPDRVWAEQRSAPRALAPSPGASRSLRPLTAGRRAERTNAHANRIATLASAIHACFRSVALASATAFDSARP